MKTENEVRTQQGQSLQEEFSEIPDPRVVVRAKHDLVEMLVISVCALRCGVDDFVGVEA